jgi:MFS transporter, PAT family, beta-lactamase induction signal transducer AmpG
MTSESTAQSKGWGEWLKGIQAYFQPRPFLMLLLGFSAGLPFLLTAGTLSTWLREAGIDRTTIGFLSWIGFAYSFKVLWAPLIDQMPLPVLDKAMGRRRAWMLVAQLAIVVWLIGFAFSQPSPDHLGPMIAFALLVAFSSATQDIVVDAWRIDAATQDEQGVMAGAYQAGYRIALFAAGAGALYIAEFFSWTAAYLTMAALMLVGVAATIFAPRVGDRPGKTDEDARIERMLDQAKLRPGFARSATEWFYKAVAAPFADFGRRYGFDLGVVILCLVSTYRMTDTVMGVMANPFYIDLGFSKDQIATVSKVYGIWIGLAGALFGGWAVAQFGLMRALVIGAIVGSASNLMFAWMALQGPDVWALTLTISVENFAGGFAGTSLIAYMSSLTSTAFTATQYALFSSFYTIPGRFIGGFSGAMVDASNYFWFFVITAVMGLPAVLLSIYLWLYGHRLSAGHAKEPQKPAA